MWGPHHLSHILAFCPPPDTWAWSSPQKHLTEATMMSDATDTHGYSQMFTLSSNPNSATGQLCDLENIPSSMTQVFSASGKDFHEH